MTQSKFGIGKGDRRLSGNTAFGRNFGSTASVAHALDPLLTQDSAANIPEDPVIEESVIDQACEALEHRIEEEYSDPASITRPRGELAQEIESLVRRELQELDFDLTDHEQRDVVTALLNNLIGKSEVAKPDPLALSDLTAPRVSAGSGQQKVIEAKTAIETLLLDHIDAAAANELSREELAEEISEVVSELLVQEKLNLNLKEQRDLVTMLLNDMLGLGPLEPLLLDETITDIMVNGHDMIYVERRGKLELTDVKFRDHQHVMNIATRIVTQIGRRVDESTPLCDARLADGSRVNIIIPPLALDGAIISIRKFGKYAITLDKMIEQANLSAQLATVLKVAAACRLNILISGGTGSGKTTLLNALSQMIDPGERIVTIEDAAELQLQQPHTIRLETRPANLEGHGEITMRDLLKNALRMRPDRIIVGEIRGGEAIDMLQAMNTGHDGSMSTIHANRPREAITRLENMVGMAGLSLPPKAIRTQISSAINLIVQISRMRDGIRRIQQVTEIVGMEGDIITTQDLFVYEYTGEDEEGFLTGNFKSTGLRPHFVQRAEYYGLHRTLLDAM